MRTQFEEPASEAESRPYIGWKHSTADCLDSSNDGKKIEFSIISSKEAGLNSMLERRCIDLVEELELGSDAAVKNVVPLTGGVASDIAMVELGDRKLCVKFALPKLKVAEDWQAPVHRNIAEYNWLLVAAQIAPESSIKLYGKSESRYGFAMEFLEGNEVYLWKQMLLEGRVGESEASRVGDLVGRIHAASTGLAFDPSPFQNHDDFRALRIEPYLTFTAERWPQLADQLNGLADLLFKSSQVLVHGDVSPKNILFKNGAPIVLDAECATMGDASFDCAFCLNHLVLKAAHVPIARDALIRSISKFWQAYSAHVSWEPADALEQRICRLLPALMLARVDGKSPVEYLDESEQELVRNLTVPLITSPPGTLREFTSQISTQLGEAAA